MPVLNPRPKSSPILLYVLLLSLVFAAGARAQPGTRSIDPAAPDQPTDVFARATALYQACNWRCQVVIPPKADGSCYTVSTSLVFPLINLSRPTLTLENACIHYTGTGYAIDTREAQPSPSSVGLVISGGSLSGNPRALGGIRLLPTSNVHIRGTQIVNFSHGDAVAIFGTEDVTIDGNFDFSANRFGVRLSGINCRQGIPDLRCSNDGPVAHCAPIFTPNSGVCGYAGNMTHVDHGSLDNLEYDIYEQAGPLAYEHLNGAYDHLELNGGGGGIFLEQSRATTVASNYFEAKSGVYLVLGGDPANPNRAATGTSVLTNDFTLNEHPSIVINNGSHDLILNNSEATGGSHNQCFLDTSTANSILMANNTVLSEHALCRNGHPQAAASDLTFATFSGSPVAADRIDFVFRQTPAGVAWLGGALIPSSANVCQTSGAGCSPATLEYHSTSTSTCSPTGQVVTLTDAEGHRFKVATCN